MVLLSHRPHREQQWTHRSLSLFSETLAVIYKHLARKGALFSKFNDRRNIQLDSPGYKLLYFSFFPLWFITEY